MISDDESVKLLARTGVSMAKKISAKLHEYHKKAQDES